jgi:CheY-like chemotaxis protein
MREELVSLLIEAFEAGIITSTVHTQVEALVQKMGMTEAEYRTIEDEIRINAYIKKVKEREAKGITFMGDLRKQYHITEEDKPVIQEKLAAAAKRSTSVKQSVPAKPQSVPVKTAPSDVMSRSEDLKHQPSTPAEESGKKPAAEKKTASKKSESAAPSGKALIAVADDNETQLFLTRSVLEENGYACATADTPEGAVKMITEQQPALVICDVNFGIGKATGMDIFTNIRTKGYRMPFIIMSAFIQREFKEHAKRIGVTEYITKPTEPEELIAVVKKYLR